MKSLRLAVVVGLSGRLRSRPSEIGADDLTHHPPSLPTGRAGSGSRPGGRCYAPRAMALNPR
ncbi:MAG TPA: hypothetical protein VN886_01880, partial [Acidimicrobiales bacterium]|nr:hypothetical protein [Acidimicrobiales bacterium]